jgi:hypothetical protein
MLYASVFMSGAKSSVPLMSKPAPPSPSKPQVAGAEPGAAGRKSGRVQFDERGQAVWEWAVQTGMFDRNATTQRVRALSESAMNLSVEETPAPVTAKAAIAPPRRGDAVTPYDRAPVATPAPKTRAPAPRKQETHGSDPYSQGPAKNPESMTFNPYDRTPTRRR